MAEERVQRTIKGRRPQFHADPAIDRLDGMIMALATEMAVLYERIDSMERIADSKGLMLRKELESYKPDAQAVAEREVWRQKLLKRMLYVYREGVDDRLAGETNETYQEFLDEIS